MISRREASPCVESTSCRHFASQTVEDESHNQRTRLRTFPYKNVPLCSSPGPPERIYLRQTPRLSKALARRSRESGDCWAEDKKGNPCAGSVQFAASSNFADHEVNPVKNRHWQLA